MFVPFRNYPIRQPARRRSNVGRAFSFLLLIGFLCAIVLVGWLLFQKTVHSQLRDRVQEKITVGLRGTGLMLNLGQARFHEGQGIQLNDIQVKLENPTGNIHPGSQSSQLEIYEAFLHAPASMTELASSELKIQAVELRRVKLKLIRDQDGDWDFQNPLGALSNLAPQSDEPIPVSLTDCEVIIFDQSSPRQTPITLSNVNIYVQPIEHEGRRLTQIAGEFQSPAISKIEFTTFLDHQLKTWQSNVGATNATLSADLISVLPPEVQSELAELQSVSGKINFHGQATGRIPLDDIPSFQINGNVADLTIDDGRLPFPIRNVSASFSATNEGFVVNEARGRLGQADFACRYWQRGILDRHDWHWDGFVNQFKFEHSPRLARWLPAYCQKFCKEYSPEGLSNIEFDLTQTGQQLKRKITANMTNMAFSYIKLPYKVENCVGRVECNNDVCTFDVRSLSGNQEIGFKGFAKGIGKQPTYQVNISAPGALPIDQKMFDAIAAQPKLSKVLRAFNPTGGVAGIGTIEKQVPNGIVSKSFDIRLQHCSILHNHFNYPIHNVVGLVEVRNSDYTFKELSGNNGSGSVTCNGTWDPISGLNARFLCRSVQLNDQLKFSLKPDLREIWNGFRPRGTLDFMRLDMRLPINKSEVDLVVEARMEKPKNEAEANYISIHPIWFPYEINHVTGVVNIGGGNIKLTNVKGKHQRTWMVCQGDGRYTAETWSVKLKNFLVGSLRVDEDFLDAVPKALAPPIRQLQYQGLLNVKGEITIAGRDADYQAVQVAAFNADQSGSQFGTENFDAQAASRVTAETHTESTSSMAWDLKLVMNQAKMNVGMPVENVFGNVHLVGVYDGHSAECRGDLDIDSLTVYNNQITKIRGPIWLDNAKAAAGQFAVLKQNPNAQNISPLGSAENNSDSVTGQMHGGQVKLDAQLSCGANGEYYVQATLTEACLASACREFGATLENVEGNSYAAVRLAGDYSGIHSQRGEGTIQLRDAKIYELPVFLSLLKILNVRQLTRTAFDSSNIDFTIEGDKILFNRMEFLGDAISLIGNGVMNFEHDIDLNFYSVMGRNKINIPLISELYRASSQKILWLNVNGTLSNPQTHRHVLPQLNDSLKQLFQPREQSTLANRFDSRSRLPSYGARTASRSNGLTQGTQPVPQSNNSTPSNSSSYSR